MIGGMHRLLSAPDKTRLRRLTEAIERETGVEIAVLVVRRADDAPALARGYFNHVGIGKHGRDNGVLVLVAVDNRAIHIELGRGLLRQPLRRGRIRLRARHRQRLGLGQRRRLGFGL